MENLETGWIEDFDKSVVQEELVTVMDVDSLRVNLVRLGYGNHIEGVSSLDICLEKSNVLSKEEIIGIVERNCMVDGTRFRLSSVVLFNVTIDESSVRTFVVKEALEAGMPFLSSSDMVDDLQIRPTVHVLHDLNCVYLFFKPPPGITHAGTRRIRFHSGNAKKTRHKRA